MHIFDTHTHLNDQAFAGQESAYIAKAHDLGVKEMAIVGVNQASNKRSLELSHQYDGLYSIIGYHPTDIQEYNAQTEAELIEQLAQPKVVALGEIGLDYYWMVDEPAKQKDILRRQLAIARDLHLPVSFHTRSKSVHDDTAYQDLYPILREERVFENGGIIHSFNGDSEWARKFEDLGMHVSFSGVVTFNSAKATQEAVKVLNPQSILVETDAPYLAPVPKRGSQNEPAYTYYVVKKLAEILEMRDLEVADLTTKNAHRLFKLGE